jgi:hypothetical protein
MINLLAQKINMPVLVAIPVIAPDSELVVCTLLGIENEGVWLAGAELMERLPGDLPARGVSRVFVPFAQIAFLTEAPQEGPSRSEALEAPVRPNMKPHKSRK